MKKYFVITTCFMFSVSFSQNVWIKRDSVNGPPRGACASFELNNEAFVLTGVNVEDFKRKMYSYDLEQDDWDNEAPLGGIAGSGLERASAVGFSVNGKGYLALGSASGIYMKDVWQYDPETEAWTQMADFTGTGRSGAIAFSVDDVAYVGLGQDAAGLYNDFYRYDPTINNWETLANFEGGARKEAVGFTMGGKGYVGTGRGVSSYYNDFWEYDPTNDLWNQKANFPGTPRVGAVGCGVFPSAFVMLGEDNDFEYRNDVWEYNYFGDIWTQRADYPGGSRTQASAIAVGSRIFVGLGYDGIYHDDFYEYEQVLSTGERLESSNFSIFPNPVLAYFMVNYPTNYQQVSLKIYNNNGREITSAFEINKTQSNQLKIDLLQNLSKGNYFVSLFNDEQIIGSKKIVLF